MPDRSFIRRAAPCAAALAVVLLAGACTSARRPAPVVERLPPDAVSAPKPAAAPAAHAPEPAPRPEFYTVKRGDTLYTIALDHGMDYQELVELNKLANVNLIRAGQQLRLRAFATGAIASPFAAAPAVEGKPVAGAALPAGPGGVAVKSQPKAVKLPYSDHALAQLVGQPQTKPAPPAIARIEPKSDGRAAAVDSDEAEVDWGWPAGGRLASTFNESTNLKGIGIMGRMGQPVIASAPGKVLYSGDGIR